jgi:hypothetical protein
MAPRARYIAPTDRDCHRTLKQQIAHLAPIFLDRGDRLLKANDFRRLLLGWGLEDAFEPFYEGGAGFDYRLALGGVVGGGDL